LVDGGGEKGGTSKLKKRGRERNRKKCLKDPGENCRKGRENWGGGRAKDWPSGAGKILQAIGGLSKPVMVGYQYFWLPNEAGSPCPSELGAVCDQSKKKGKDKRNYHVIEERRSGNTYVLGGKMLDGRINAVTK